MSEAWWQNYIGTATVLHQDLLCTLQRLLSAVNWLEYEAHLIVEELCSVGVGEANFLCDLRECSAGTGAAGKGSKPGQQ